MEVYKSNTTEGTKRFRDDSDENSSASKLARVDSLSGAYSSESMLTRMNSDEECANSSGFELIRFDSDDPVLDSPVPRDIQNDILNILDDTDNIPERETTMQGLDSVIKSFEEEILASGHNPDPVPELQMDLGYLLEASDDELGLPPSVTRGEEAKPAEGEVFDRVGSGDEVFENVITGYDLVGLGNTEDKDKNIGHGGVVGLDGLFDYPESYDVLWRSESLQAM